MRLYPSLGVQSPQILLPRQGVNLTRWAVIACDQFTSQPDYWCQVEDLVLEEPSTLHLILPEVYLDGPDLDGRTLAIQAKMWRYLHDNTLQAYDGMVYLERSLGAKTRRGLVLALDLERYDYRKGAATLIRATEGTIIERIHPRLRIRDGAVLELPHILVLIDDPQGTVIEPLAQQRDSLPLLYDFELMLGSGHLRGHWVNDLGLEQKLIQALERLADPQVFAARYGLAPDVPVMLFAMGDGNHSFATAKTLWERNKARLGMDHPMRYALVEIENIHDPGLTFEPIHRVVFRLQVDILADLKAVFGDNLIYTPLADCAEMARRVDEAQSSFHTIGLITASGGGLLEIAHPSANIAVGTLQNYLDDFMQQGKAEKIDYVHGRTVVCQLGSQPHNAGFYLPVIDKSDLFKTVILDGALARKAFSMGEAHEKRFYLECRRLCE